ncbi:hypothetical protein EDD36DRAFT_132197 [Exophiala viscosa]|uniref:Impact N-terminal domain-containing protein n=1 Tax=Exophiala viscosa TaxID=2486360 RepID=A0AAN6E3K9_9EURO|nr:hypothetical protein EDD36DRAFT_132197 [Exophiala viscosa]
MSMSQKRPLPQDTEEDSDADQVFRSSPIQDRSSTFVAHFHPLSHANTTHGGKPVPLTSTVKSFQSHPDFVSADHRMVAWRRPSTQRTLAPSTVVGVSHAIYTTGSDDDGEKYAGKKLERVLIDLDVEGTVVVARWYGGIMLGPVRFTHIETVAREAIMMWKAQQDHDSAKRQKVQQEVADKATRARLVRVLGERDNSIVVLRGLLAEKTGTATAKSADAPSQTQTATPTITSSSTTKKIDYSVMPLQTLRQLEKARDATIAFILKQIDKAEDEEKKRKSAQEAAAVTDGDTEDGNAVTAPKE